MVARLDSTSQMDINSRLADVQKILEAALAPEALMDQVEALKVDVGVWANEEREEVVEPPPEPPITQSSPPPPNTGGMSSPYTS